MSEAERAGSLTAISAARLFTGFDADLVAVAGDPRQDVNALTSVVRVWRAGREVVSAR